MTDSVWRRTFGPGLNEDLVPDYELAQRVKARMHSLEAENARLAIKCGEADPPLGTKPLEAMSDAELIAVLRARGYGVLGESARPRVTFRCVCGTTKADCEARGSHRPCCPRCSETDARSHR